jgi:hypothetical protein
VSIDGFGAGPDQSLEHPLGKRGEELHSWFYPTRTFRSMVGEAGGTDRQVGNQAGTYTTIQPCEILAPISH